MIILAYVVGVAGLAHIIAGSAECLFVVFKGEATISAYVVRFLASSFLGNSIGGVALVDSLAHAKHATSPKVLCSAADQRLYRECGLEIVGPPLPLT